MATSSFGKTTSPHDQLLSSLQHYLKIVFSRKLWIIISLTVGTSIAFIYSYSKPDTYRSSTMIMIDRQRIPESYVQTTITTGIHDRLNTISQQILSRTNLEGIIQRFEMHKEDDFIPLTKKINQKILDATKFDIEAFVNFLGFHKAKSDRTLEDIVESLRNSIEVRVVGSNNAFSVSHVGRDPYTVMHVTDTLAKLFIEENLRIREQQAEGTTEFLEIELAEAERDLEKQEKSLKEFKAQHMGALPEQMDANLRTLDRLQTELQSISNDLRNVTDRKFLFEQELKEYEKQALERQILERQLSGIQQDTASLVPVPDTALDTKMATLVRLKEELTRLRSQFNDNYPDVVILKSQIHNMETRLSEGRSSLDSLEHISQSAAKFPTMEGIRSQASDHILGQQLERLRVVGAPPHVVKAQLQSAHSEIERLDERRRRTAAMIKEFEQRVEETFANEQKLVSVTRDYEMSRQNYQTLLQKRLNARVSENLEKRQQGERFRILDPANLPQKPYQPNRPKNIALGSLLSVGVGVGLILVKEHFRPTYRTVEDIHGGMEIPALVVIPYNKITQKRHRTLVTVKEPDSPAAEQYRVLYTKLSRLNEMRSRREDEVKSYSMFAISSAIKNEGKTITSLNLAIVTARDFGKKTLLIEGDLRSPALTTYLDRSAEAGLIDILNENTAVHSSIIPFVHENLFILPAGKGRGNPSRVLSAPQMKEVMSLLKEQYDYIFIDAPPILALPDMNIIESFVDGVILVVRSEKTSREAISLAIRSLQTDKLIGFVLNDVRQPVSQYYDYYSTSI